MFYKMKNLPRTTSDKVKCFWKIVEPFGIKQAKTFAKPETNRIGYMIFQAPLILLLIIQSACCNTSTGTVSPSPEKSEKNIVSNETNQKNKTFSVATFNVANFGGFPAKKRTASVAFYDKAFKSINADILVLQECSGSFSKKVANQMGWHIVNFPGGFGSPYHYDQSRRYCSGAILSRYPICDFKDFSKHKNSKGKYAFSRHFGRATICIDSRRKVMIYGAHFWPYDNVKEAAQVIALMKKDKVDKIPQIFLGDLNAHPKSPVIALFCKGGFVDAYKLKGKGQGLTSHSDTPTERIDYVFAEKGLSQFITSADVVMNPYTHLKNKKRQQYVASDHMPVITRFLLPSPSTTQSDFGKQ